MKATLSPTDFRLLVVVQVAGVVANLVDVGCDLRAESVVLLQIDRKWGGGLLADSGERLDVFARVDGDADEVGAGGFEQLDLADRGLDVLRARRGHRLDDDGIAAADGHVADLDRSRRIAAQVAG